MRRYTYVIGISLIAACILLTLLISTSLGRMTEYSGSDLALMWRDYAWRTNIKALANPVPFFLSQYIPDFVETLLKWGIALATARRIYLWAGARAIFPPANMTRLQLAVIVFALACFALVLINHVLVLTGLALLTPIALYSAFGVFLLGPAILWVEIMSVRDDLRLRGDA